MTTENNQLTDYFAFVQQTGKLRTPAHARQWSRGVLNTLGLDLDRSTKKKLAQSLPDELAVDLTRVFWLAHFRNGSLSQHEFLNKVSRRSGNSDPNFARFPTTAVFHQLKAYAGSEISEQVAQTLSPAMRQMWEAA